MILAGVWVGLAFQAKMIEAWLVIPALVLTYLVASAGTGDAACCELVPWWRSSPLSR